MDHQNITIETGTRGQPGYRPVKRQLDELVARGWKPAAGASVDIRMGDGTFDRIGFDQVVLVVTRYPLPADKPGTLALPIGRVPGEHERFVDQARKHLAKKGWTLVNNTPPAEAASEGAA